MKQNKSSEKMVHKKNEQKIDLIPLNHELYDEFTICELEERLETKPWICGAHVDCPSLECGGTNNQNPTPAPTEPAPTEPTKPALGF